MSFWDTILGWLFGRNRNQSPPPPPPVSPPRPSPPKPPPPVGQTPPAPPPVAPPPPVVQPPPPPPQTHFLDTLVAQTRDKISGADYSEVAGRLGCEVAVIRAFFTVEAGGRSGFEADGKPTILYEPHIFSRRTQRKFDAINPNVSYPNWDRTKYPPSQAGRWAQLREAYGLDSENALASASWGAFQVMGFHFQRCGFSTAAAFVSDMSKSEARQLAAFEAFVRGDPRLAQACRDKNWRLMAELYNGAGAIDVYAPRLERAYNDLKNAPIS